MGQIQAHIFAQVEMDVHMLLAPQTQPEIHDIRSPAATTQGGALLAAPGPAALMSRCV